MAELGLLASIVQVADIGLRLSLRLYAFGETVASADRSISAISNDVSLTSSVLKELGDLLKSDTSRIYSDNAVKTADAAVRECSKAFTEMDEMLLKKVPQLHTGDSTKQSRASLILERLRWPAIKGKIELLRVNLDRMKSTLTLMLNVIIYAKQVSEKKESPSVLSDQRQLIEDLAKANQDRKREFNELRLALEGTHLDRERPATNFKSSPAPTASLVALPQMKSHGAKIPPARKGQLLDPTCRSVYDGLPMTGSGLRLLLDEFTKLHSRLLIEVRSTDYKIESESRARYESDITSRHNQELQAACKSKQNVCNVSATDSFTPKMLGTPSLGPPRKADTAAHTDHVGQEQDAADDASISLDQASIARSGPTPATAKQWSSSKNTSLYSSHPSPSDDLIVTGRRIQATPAYNSAPIPFCSMSSGSVRKSQTSSDKKKKKISQAGVDRGSNNDEETHPPKTHQCIFVDSANASGPPPLIFGGQKDSSISIPNPPSLGYDASMRIPFDDIQASSQMPPGKRMRHATASSQIPSGKRMRRATASYRFSQGRREKDEAAANNITQLEKQAKNMADADNEPRNLSDPNEMIIDMGDSAPAKKGAKPWQTQLGVYQRDSYRREGNALHNALVYQGTSLSTSNTSHGKPCGEPQSEGADLHSKYPTEEEEEGAWANSKDSSTENERLLDGISACREAEAPSTNYPSQPYPYFPSQPYPYFPSQPYPYFPSQPDSREPTTTPMYQPATPPATAPQDRPKIPFSAGVQTPNRTFSGSYNPIPVTGVTPNMSTAPIFPFHFAPSATESSQTLPNIGEMVWPHPLFSLPEKRLPSGQKRRPPALASFDGQVASHQGRQAVGTSQALRPSKDTMTVDSLISKWTNLVSSSPGLALRVQPRQSS